MHLSKFSIRYPLAILIVIILFISIGLVAIKALRVNQLPDVELPIIVIDFPYPGASPDSVEREIIDHVEKPMLSIPDVNQIHSTANEGMATIIIMFNFEKNMVEATDEIRNAIALVRHKLPLEMREPIVRHSDPFARPTMTLALSSSTLSLAQISQMAEDTIADQLRTIDGVSVVNVNGALQRELSVLLHAERLREYNISTSDVVEALTKHNTTAPAGRIKGLFDEQSIRLEGRIKNASEFEQIILKRIGGRTVRLGQVASIEDGFAEPSSLSMRNGKPNITIEVIRSRNSSTITVADEVREVVSRINKSLPSDTKLFITQDGGSEVQRKLNNVVEALLYGALFTVIVVYIFLNSWRSTVITALSLPTSVLAAFVAVWAFGFTLNFMTLLALSLAIGVLIDDAIVVRENIMRHMERGSDRITAASVGTQEIGLAVTATTFSIIAVFIPVAFMHGGAGAYFRPFALTVTAAVLVSLFISFTLDPMLSAYWNDPVENEKRNRHWLSVSLAKFNSWFDSKSQFYGSVIHWALNRRQYMVVIATLSFIGALMLQAIFGGSSFMPATDSGNIAINVLTPSSAALEYNKRKTETAAEIARTLPEAIATNSTVFAGGGRVLVDIGKSTERHRSASEIATALRALLTRLVGAKYTVIDDLNGGISKPIQIQFSGSDARRLSDIATDFMLQMAKIPGAVDIGLSELEPKDELKIDVDRDVANSLGISVEDVAQTLRAAFAGITVGNWIDPTGKSRDIAVRFHPNDRVNASNIEQIPIPLNGSNMMVPLDQVATITMGKGPAQIQHFDGKRMITVSANAQGRSPGEITADALKIARQIRFPEGYGLELGGASRDQQKVFSEISTALVIGILLMYLILVLQFNSLTAPLPVLLSLPLSLIGVVLALLAAHCTLNLMSLIGIVMLMGLVAKNAILLLDCSRKAERKGVERKLALAYAGQARLRPILMTTFALIAGMLPVAIGYGEGSEFYRPMGVAIIGGTITSTLLTLLIVPAFYDSIETARAGAVLKYNFRKLSLSTPLAFVLTLLESLMTLLFVRFIYRKLKKYYRHSRIQPRAT